MLLKYFKVAWNVRSKHLNQLNECNWFLCFSYVYSQIITFFDWQYFQKELIDNFGSGNLDRHPRVKEIKIEFFR